MLARTGVPSYNQRQVTWKKPAVNGLCDLLMIVAVYVCTPAFALKIPQGRERVKSKFVNIDRGYMAEEKPQTAEDWAFEAGKRWKYSPATRDTLVALAHFIQHDNNPCPSFKAISEKTGRALATTQGAIQQMERDGVIIRVQRAGRAVQGGLTCHYTLVGYAGNLPIPDRKIVSLLHYPTGEYVYLLRTELGHHKIGCTTDPAKRMQTFITTIPIAVEYVCLIRCQDRLVTERELHSRFAKKRKQGEWFDLSPEDVEVIKAMAVQP